MRLALFSKCDKPLHKWFCLIIAPHRRIKLAREAIFGDRLCDKPAINIGRVNNPIRSGAPAGQGPRRPGEGTSKRRVDRADVTCELARVRFPTVPAPGPPDDQETVDEGSRV